MNIPFVALDHVLLAVILATGVIEWRWQYPPFLRALAAGDASARPRYYQIAMLIEWAMACGVVALWIAERRPWSALLLGGSTPLRLTFGWALAAAYLALSVTQWRVLRTRPERLARVMKRMGDAQALVPHTRGERRWFAALSVTAGVCEELLFRGFVLWYTTRWLGPIGGCVVSSVAFGLMHVYLGTKHVPRTAIGGLLFYTIAMLAGSLVPAMVVHAVADLISGDVGYHNVAGAPAAAPAPNVPAAPAAPA